MNIAMYLYDRKENPIKENVVNVTLWVPSDCPMGSNGEIIAKTASFEEAVAMNEQAREFGGHIQAHLPGREGPYDYFAGMAESDEGIWWRGDNHPY